MQFVSFHFAIALAVAFSLTARVLFFGCSYFVLLHVLGHKTFVTVVLSFSLQ